MFKKTHFLPMYCFVFAAPLYAAEELPFQKLDDMIVSAPLLSRWKIRHILLPY